jgi:putative membrane protein
LFWLILNGICLAIADKLAGNAFNIDNFGWAFIGAIVLSIVSGLVQQVFEQGAPN